MYIDDIAEATLRDDFKLSEAEILKVDKAYKQMEEKILTAIRECGIEISDITSKYKRIFDDLDNKNRDNRFWKLSDFCTEVYSDAGDLIEYCTSKGIEDENAQDILGDLRKFALE